VEFDPARHPHRRLNPLTGDWIVVSPQRTERPWNGRAGSPVAPGPAYDPGCYLCPGNARAGGVRNPDYDSTFVFDNDFPALLRDAPEPPVGDDDLLRVEAATGECRVICFSPRHDLTLATMDHGDLVRVVDLWRTQLDDLLGTNRWVQIFETRGAMAGASNAHPHGQIWASEFLPTEATIELGTQRRYRADHGRPMLLDYVERELAQRERIVAVNDAWAVVVPYWAYWPYETLVLPRRPVASLTDLHPDECELLADVLGSMLRAFDAVFDTPFPYCSGWHTAPLGHEDAWQLHAHYYPPLLRSAEVAKMPASYELLANLQRDVTPERAASRLRELL
jgi:UDPglucose--hexose-1-phosphate uridylyltransferase